MGRKLARMPVLRPVCLLFAANSHSLMSLGFITESVTKKRTGDSNDKKKTKKRKKNVRPEQKDERKPINKDVTADSGMLFLSRWTEA